MKVDKNDKKSKKKSIGTIPRSANSNKTKADRNQVHCKPLETIGNSVTIHHPNNTRRNVRKLSQRSEEKEKNLRKHQKLQMRLTLNI